MKIISLICIISIFIVLSACQRERDCSLYGSLIEMELDSAMNLFTDMAHKENLTQEERAFSNLLSIKIDLGLKKEILSDSIINSAIKYYEKNNNISQLAYAYFYKAKISFMTDADSLAILYALKSIDKAKISHHLTLLVEAYNQLGLIYLFQNLLGNSQREFEKAYSLTDSIPRKFYYKPLLLRNIARTYSLRSSFSGMKDKQAYGDTTVLYYNQALSYLTDSTSPSLLTSIYRELTTTYILMDDYPNVFKYLDAGIDSSDMVLYYNQKSTIFMRTGQLDSAYFYVQKCMEDPRLYIRYNLYDKLYRIELRKKNAWKALEYVDTLLVLSDSIIVHTIPDKVIEIQKKYNEEKLRAEKANIQAMYEKGKVRSLTILFIIVLLLVLVIYIYIYDYFKKKKLQQSLLKQKNELLLLNHKMQQWNQQMMVNHRKIERLEQEKKQIESDLYSITKEKETILKENYEELEHYRKLENDLLLEKIKYEELCFVAFKKMFLSMPLSKKIPAFGVDKIVIDKLNTHLQKQLMEIMDDICFGFASRLYILLQESTDKTCLCCLIKLQVKPKYIMILCDLNRDAYYKQCQRIAENLIGKNSASALKDFLTTF